MYNCSHICSVHTCMYVYIYIHTCIYLCIDRRWNSRFILIWKDMCEQTISPTGHQGRFGSQMKQVGCWHLTTRAVAARLFHGESGPMTDNWYNGNQQLENRVFIFLYRYFSPIIPDVNILFYSLQLFPNTKAGTKRVLIFPIASLKNMTCIEGMFGTWDLMQWWDPAI